MDPRDPLEAAVIGSDEIALDDESFVDDDSYLVGRRRGQMMELHSAFVNLRRRDVADVVGLDVAAA